MKVGLNMTISRGTKNYLALIYGGHDKLRDLAYKDDIQGEENIASMRRSNYHQLFNCLKDSRDVKGLCNDVEYSTGMMITPCSRSAGSGMAELRVRPAQLSEYRSVMDINANVYDGFDYLPAMYRVYLHNPDAHCFVGLVADKVVGFAVLHVVDGGTAVVSEAGRVDMSLKSQGIFSRMIGQAVTITRTRVPGVQIVLHSAFDIPHFDSHAQLEKEGRAFERTVCYWNLLIYKRPCAAVKQGLSSCIPPRPADLITVMDAESSEIALKDPTNFVSMFPSGYIVGYHNSFPMRAWWDNILRAMKDHYTLGTYDGNRTTLRALSLGFACTVSFGCRYDIHYYDKVPDSDVLLQHVIHHLRHVVSMTDDHHYTGVIVHFPLGHDRRALQEALVPITGTNIISKTFPRERGVLFEGPLLPLSTSSSKL